MPENYAGIWWEAQLDILWFHQFFQKQERADRVTSNLKKPRSSLNAIRVETVDGDEDVSPDTVLAFGLLVLFNIVSDPSLKEVLQSRQSA